MTVLERWMSQMKQGGRGVQAYVNFFLRR